MLHASEWFPAGNGWASTLSLPRHVLCSADQCTSRSVLMMHVRVGCLIHCQWVH
jgi:hypothetical protein